LTFSGIFNGPLSEADVGITSSFQGAAAQSLTLGGNEYVVTLGAFTLPTAPGDTGELGAHVDVRAGLNEPPPVITDAPEPSTWALAGLGLALAGLGAWWRRRQVSPVLA
jgi:hypothetical protein